ncbi:MAG TPA: DUF4921 family protein [Candidatus Lustribacter sp.]|nr:DUF4921 family protein [Candidatus Lustribacter sp.]
MTEPTPGPVPWREPLVCMADGTVKQKSPFTGLEVWTIPGRAERPIGGVPTERHHIDIATEGRVCAFCERCYLQTPPEKARIIRDPGGGWRTIENVPAAEVESTVAEFRLVPNLFSIVSLRYWTANYGYHLSPEEEARRAAYLASPDGLAHILALVRHKLRLRGIDDGEWAAMSSEERLSHAPTIFGGGHDLVVARRHHVEGAKYEDDLASAGTLTPDEHGQYVALSVIAMRNLFRENPFVRYVSAFQNWLRPAGASFDHLHRQLVAIDEYPARAEFEIPRLRRDPDLYNTMGVDYAVSQRLIVAENETAIAYAGFGHRYPTLMVCSKSEHMLPWDHTPAEIRGMSDLLHACHAATGALVPTNEEWHYRPPLITDAMPWRFLLKWRLSTSAGFEGGTGIYINTIDPWQLRERVVRRLVALQRSGRLAAMSVGDACAVPRGVLRYRG